MPVLVQAAVVVGLVMAGVAVAEAAYRAFPPEQPADTAAQDPEGDR